MNNKWFWENRFMAWAESKLLTFTSWFWNKRHQPQPKKEPQLDTTTQNKPRTPAKKTSAKKKTDWNVK